MKKNYLFAVALVAAALTGCSQDELVDFNPEVKSGFTASLETVESRTVLDANNKVQWVASNDHVSLYEKVDINAKYQVSSVNDNGTAKLTYVSHIDKSDYQVLDQYYAVYPYNDNNTIATDGTITAPVPAAYTYKDKESCIASALMVARSDSKSLRFTNAQGIIRLKLNAKTPYTWGMIQSITFTSKANYLSGTATMSWNGTDTPVAVIDTDAEGKGQSLTINLDESLKKDLPSKQSGEYVEFYVPVVPTTFAEKDLTMVVTFANNKTYKLEDIEKEIAIARKEIVTLRHTIGSDDFSADIEDEVVSDEVSNEAQLIKALKAGGKVTLVNDITLTETANIPEGVTVSLNLNGKTISNDNGYIFENKGNLTIDGNGTFKGLGIIRSTAGFITIESGNFYASSDWNDGTYQHTLKAENTNVVINGGNFDATINGQTNAMLNASTGSTITINGGNFKNVAGDLTNFDPYIFHYEADGKVIIKDGTYYGGWRFAGETATTNIYGGTFTVGYDGQSFNANSTHVVTVYGGTFVTQTYAKLTTKLSDIVAEDYHALQTGDKYYVVPESIDAIVSTAEELQAALDAATGEALIVQAADITGNVTVTQKENVTIVIEGNNYKFEGIITVNGQSMRYDTAGLTIQNVKFVGLTASGSNDAYVKLGTGDNSTRYTNHVTVKGCEFSGTSMVAVKSYTGGDYNVTLEGLTVNAGMHSLAQLKNVEQNLSVTNNMVYSKNGLNVNNGNNLTMSGCTFDVQGYAVRFGSDANTTDETFNISNSTLKSACADGDPVIEFRKGAVNATLYLTNTTLEGTTTISGNTSETIIIIDGMRNVETSIEVPVAPLEEDFLFPAGTNAVMYKDMVMSGEAQIVHTENAVLGLSNVIADLDHTVIVRKSGGAICIENSEFTLTDGAKLISVGEGGDAHQVFLINVKVNGELLTSENAGQYLEGISWFGAYPEWPQED